MGTTTEPKMTSGERLTQGLRYTAVGPVDITRGAVGLTVHSAQSTAADVRRRYRDARLAHRMAKAQKLLSEQAPAVGEAVADVVSALPQTLQDAAKSERRGHRRLWLLGGVGLATLVGGAVAFSIVRRSAQPDTSTLPPSIEVVPRP